EQSHRGCHAADSRCRRIPQEARHTSACNLSGRGNCPGRRLKERATADPQEGRRRNRQRYYRDRQGGRAWSRVRGIVRFARSATHSGRACVGNVAVSCRRRGRLTRAKWSTSVFWMRQCLHLTQASPLARFLDTPPPLAAPYAKRVQELLGV